MSKWRDRLSDAAVAARETNLSDTSMFGWNLYIWECSQNPYGLLFSCHPLIRARVYDSLSCDGLGVDELDDEPVMSERRER